MALDKRLKTTIRQGIVETMSAHITEGEIDTEGWQSAVGEWLADTHPDYNLRLMIVARDAVLTQLINDYIRSTRHVEPENVLDIGDLRHEIELNNRIVRIREANGKFRTKRIKETTKREVREVALYYGKSRRNSGRREDFYRAIYREMDRLGLGDDAPVSLLLEDAA